MVTYLDRYNQRSNNRFFNSVDTLVQRARLINQPYHHGHIGLPRSSYFPAFITHTGLLLAQFAYVAQGIVNLGLSIFSPTDFPNTFLGLAMDVGSFFIKALTVLLALVSLVTRSLAICVNPPEEEHSYLGDCFDADCDDTKLEKLVENFQGYNERDEMSFGM